MKKVLIFIFCSLCLSGFSQVPNRFEEGESKLKKMEGLKAPYFQLRNLTNDTVDIDSFSSDIILLEFSGLYCGPCRLAIPYLKEIENTFKSKQFKVVTIIIPAPKDSLLKFVHKYNISSVYLIGNEKVNDNYNIFLVPAFFIIRNGIVLKTFSGFKPGITDLEIKGFLETL